MLLPCFFLSETGSAASSPVVINEFQASNNGPESLRLHPARPNPFNNRATVTVAVPESGHLRVSTYSVDGRKVATLLDDMVQGGYHEISIDSSIWASGIYMITASSGSCRAVHSGYSCEIILK